MHRQTLIVLLLALAMTASSAQAVSVASVRDFFATPVEAASISVTLRWVNPTSVNFAGVKILRRGGGLCPTGPTDLGAVVVYDGSATSASDSAVAGSTTYCYTAYAHDVRPVFSSGVSVTVTTPATLTLAVFATPPSGPAPLTTTLTASASGGSTPYSFAWTLPTGTATGSSISATFASVGTVNPSVTVTDASGATATVTATVTVTAPSAALTATATASPTSGQVPLTTRFTSTVTGGRSPYTYHWDFGDSQSSTQANPSHAYTTAGTFEALLRVQDAAGTAATANVVITATAAPPGPLVTTATASPTSGTAALATTLVASVSGGTPPYTVSWDFGDGTSDGSGTSVAHTYATAGTYTAVATVTDDASARATANVTVTVSAPVAPPAVSDLQGFDGNTTTLLTWTTPTSPSVAGVRVLRRQDADPTSPTDAAATVVFEGLASRFHDQGLAPDTDYHYAVYTYGSGTPPLYATSAPTVTARSTTTPVSFITGGVARMTHTSFTITWTTNKLTDAHLDIIRRSSGIVIGSVQRDFGSDEATTHTFVATIAMPLQAWYDLVITTTDAAGLAATYRGMIMPSYVDSANNFWYGFNVTPIGTDGSREVPAGGWNGTADVTRCDNTCNQYYTCSAFGVADCSDARNGDIGAKTVCGGIAMADCEDGQKDLPSGPNGTLTQAALDAWPGARIPRVTEYALICGRGFMDVPTISGTGLQTPELNTSSPASIRIFGRATSCTAATGSIDGLATHSLIPTGSWTP